MRKFEWKDGDIAIEYWYGMKLRGFSPGCQPKNGFVRRLDDSTGKYWDVLVYNRPLTEEEIKVYDLEVYNA